MYSVKELANCILEIASKENVELSNMSINKLVYFAYEHALVKYGISLNSAKMEAWDHGPVFRELYGAFKQYSALPITAPAQRYDPKTDRVENVVPHLTVSDLEVITEAIQPLIKLPAFILREISHDQGGAWAAVWNHKSRTNPGMEITDEIILSSKPTASLMQ